VSIHEFNGDVRLGNETSSNTLADSADQLLLRRLLGVVNAEDVGAFGLGFGNFLNHAGQVSNVNCGHVVVALANEGQTGRLLEPGLFEVRVKDSFSLAVQDTSRNNVALDVGGFEVQNQIFSLLDCVIFG